MDYYYLAASLPGVALGFLWNMAKDPVAIFIGATIAGLLGSTLVGLIQQTTRLKEDTASFNQGNLADTLRKQGYDVRALKDGYKSMLTNGFPKAEEAPPGGRDAPS